MSYYSPDELPSLGLARFGDDVRISKKASLYNPGRIAIGSHVRIDDFSVLSAGEGMQMFSLVSMSLSGRAQLCCLG